MTKQNIHINDDLLIRYLANEITEAESNAVNNWLAESDANQKILAHYRILFEESAALKPEGFGDADKAWKEFDLWINEHEVEITTYPFKKWIGIAASIIVILFAGTWFYLRQPPAVNFYTNDQPLIDSLSDGSLISLNNHSSLSFKNGKVREVTLTGEAFFAVKHDASHPFRIKVNDIMINVLGTSFNVKSIGNQTEIMVRSGIVGVSGKNQSLRLQAGEQLLTSPGKTWHKQAQNGFDINKYPGLLRAILKNPEKWPQLLNDYIPKQGAHERRK